MAGEANNLASYQGPEPNILNRKQLNFNVQMYIFPLKIKHRKVEYSKQTTVREVCTRVSLLSNIMEYFWLRMCLLSTYATHRLKYRCWPEVRFWTGQCFCCCTVWKHPAYGPERINFSAFNAKLFRRFWLSIRSRSLLLPQNRKSIDKTQQIPYFPTGVSWPFYVRGVKQILIFSQRYCCDYLGRDRWDFFVFLQTTEL